MQTLGLFAACSTLILTACIGAGLGPRRSTASAQGPWAATYLPVVMSSHAATLPVVSRVESLTTSLGQTRTYQIYAPPLPVGRAVPLVISIHGLGSNAGQQEALTGFSLKAQQNGFIAVYPNAIGAWGFVDTSPTATDLVFLRELIADLQARYSIDAKRIYANGISNGAQMSHRLACSLGETVAAVGLVAGGYFRQYDCPGTTPVAAVIFHGTADTILPYQGNSLLLSVPEFAADWAARNGCTAGPSQTFSNGGVTGQTWSTCTASAEVVFYTTDKGHSWPGSSMPPAITTQDINATTALWDFFTAHPKP